MRFSGKKALITGGGGGIGEAIARSFGSAGADVSVIDVDGARAKAVATAIGASGVTAIGLQCDVSNSAEVKRAVRDTVTALGTVDVLVNNAGIMDRAPFLDTPMATFDRIMAVNVRGAFECSVEVGKVMAVRGNGVIIHVTSIEDGRGALTSGVPYSTSKGAQKAMVVSSAVHLAPYGIRVVGLAPGMVPSGLNNNNPRGDRSRILAGRPGTQAEIAAAALFLASDDASYVNGTTLYVDGGWCATL